MITAEPTLLGVSALLEHNCPSVTLPKVGARPLENERFRQLETKARLIRPSSTVKIKAEVARKGNSSG